MASDLAQLAYEASLRRLDKQEALLGEIRARTGALVAVAALAASVLGRPALDADPAALAALALAAFALSIAASLYVLVPRKQLAFSLVGPWVYEEFYEFRDDIAEVQRLAYDLQRFWEANERTMHRLLRGFQIATWALAVEVVLLLASLSGIFGRTDGRFPKGTSPSPADSENPGARDPLRGERPGARPRRVLQAARAALSASRSSSSVGFRES